MPRVEVTASNYKASWGKNYKKGEQFGITDEEYQENSKKLKFLSPTTDRTINIKTGRIEEVIRPDSKEV